VNKGRNIAILLGCMLCISILTFLVRWNIGNHQGVVDNVRYVKGETKDDFTEYEFYFIDRDKLDATLEYKGDNEWMIIFDDYEYNYRVVGTNRKDAKIEALPQYDVLETEPFDVISKRVFLYMIFGKPPVLTIPQAILVFLFFVSGLFVIIKAEELWYIVGRRSREEIPKWEDLNVYKYAGGAIIGLAALLLIIFIII